MENNNIYVNVEGLDASIIELKELIKSSQTIFDNQKLLFDKISKVWGGTSGEKVNKELADHSKEYDSLLSKMNEKVSFLEEVRNSYLKADTDISNKIDDNVKLEA